MLLRRECCTFSNGEYVKSGICVLEKWIVDTEEVRSRPFSHLYLDQHSTVHLLFSTLQHAGAAWDELQFIRQAVDFLVKLSIIHSFQIARFCCCFYVFFSYTMYCRSFHRKAKRPLSRLRKIFARYGQISIVLFLYGTSQALIELSFQQLKTLLDSMISPRH